MNNFPEEFALTSKSPQKLHQLVTSVFKKGELIRHRRGNLEAVTRL